MSIFIATNGDEELGHISAIESQRSDVTVYQRAENLAELLSLAQAGWVDVILCAADTEHIQLSTLEPLRESIEHGVRVAALSDDDDERARLATLGVSTQSLNASGEILVSWLREVARSPVPVVPNGSFTVTDADIDNLFSEHEQVHDSTTPEVDGNSSNPQDIQDSAGSALIEHPGAAPEQLDAARTRGKLTAVWGPVGAPGKSTVAVNLAVESMMAGYSTLLIDADTYGASVAPMLGLLDESAGLAQAVRLADSSGLELDGLLNAVNRVEMLGSELYVLTGLNRPDRWPEIRRAGFEAVLSMATRHWQHIIVDCGFGLEEDEALSYDHAVPQRNLTTLSALSSAHTVVGVGTGDAVGLPRMIRAVSDFQSKNYSSRLVTVFNKVSAATSGLAPKAQIREVWEKFGSGEAIDHFISDAQKDCARSLLSGRPLAEVVPDSPLRSEIQTLLSDCGFVPSSNNSSRAATTKKSRKSTRPVNPEVERAPESYLPSVQTPAATSRRSLRAQRKKKSSKIFGR